MGFGLFTVPVLANLFLEEEYGLGSFGRGAVATVGGVAGARASCRSSAGTTTGMYRKDPSEALRLDRAASCSRRRCSRRCSTSCRTPVLFAILGIPGAVLLSASFAMVGPVLTAVVPYRLRGMGAALGALYVFFVGATGGALLAALLTNAYGPRVAVLVLFIPSTVIGGLLILRSSLVHQGRPGAGRRRDPRGGRGARAAARRPRPRSRRCR